MTPEEILRDADTAMYRAKAAGRGCYQVFDQTMHRSVVALLKLETELRRAVEQKQFVMHYQPIVSLEDGRIVGFEGLVRWCHPERGLVEPDALHRGGRGDRPHRADRLVGAASRRAGTPASGRTSFPPTRRSTSASTCPARWSMQPDMYDRVVAILEKTGLPPTSLRLEITENVIMDHGEVALEKLAQFHKLGVQFSVDDFGTGYSSLSYLQRFSYDTLKIDRSFISGMDTKGRRLGDREDDRDARQHARTSASWPRGSRPLSSSKGCARSGARTRRGSGSRGRWTARRRRRCSSRPRSGRRWALPPAARRLVYSARRGQTTFLLGGQRSRSCARTP